ncbi:MAG: response regulator [Candidatus Korobacteraceae bacterium]
MKAILFVEDHKLLARMGCEVLERQGYFVVSAGNAEAALARFGKETFDMVVTDYLMEGMDGVELARRLRAQAPGLPIIVVSGCAAPEPCDEVSAWVEKENMFPALLETIRRLLNEPVAGERRRSA